MSALNFSTSSFTTGLSAWDIYDFEFFYTELAGFPSFYLGTKAAMSFPIV
jgi:hypothetical protein